MSRTALDSRDTEMNKADMMLLSLGRWEEQAIKNTEYRKRKFKVINSMSKIYQSHTFI